MFGEPLPRRAFAVRARLGLLGHEPLLYRDLTGRENLRYHARLHGVSAASASTRCSWRCRWSGGAEEPVRLLSRGMVQRLAVCRAVLHAPELLLLDEPRANLDPAASELVEPLIGRASGCTRVLTSHDPQAALAEADLVLALKDGRPAFVGAPGDLGDGPAAGAVRVRTALVVLRKDLRLELRTLETVPAMVLFALVDVRDLPFRAQPATIDGQLAAGRA